MKFLLITPYLNGYHDDMENILKDMGHKTKWYFDSIRLSFFEKILNKLFKNYGRRKYKKYIDNIIAENINNHYDKVLIINAGDYLNKDLLLKLRENIVSNYIYYLWDSIKNYPNVKNILKLFDKAFSFDKEDCAKYNLNFMPLFYCESDNTIVTPQYDVSSIMTYNGNKSENYNKIMSLLPSNISLNEYLYSPNRIKYRFSSFFKSKTYKLVNKNNIHFKPLNRKEAYMLMKNSKVVIDCPRKNQNGLTMRTFETLAFGRKLITTNKNIINYDFYCEDNIFIVDENTTEIPKSFFLDGFNYEYRLSEKYSVKHFILKILDLKELN